MSNLEKTRQVLAQNHRQLVVISGDPEWATSIARKLLGNNTSSTTIWVGESPEDMEFAITPAKALKLLGQECDRLVFNTFSGLDVDAFGAVSGTVKGGGVLILLTPLLDEWPQYHDPDHQRITVAPYDYREVPGNFLRRLASIIKSDQDVLCIQQGQNDEQDVVTGLGNLLTSNYANNEIITTKEQLTAIEAIKRVAQGHRRRPLVITSDRGRGKSAALGMAAAQLIRQGFGDIVITASSFASTETAFRHAWSALSDGEWQGNKIVFNNLSLSFEPPADIAVKETGARLLLVDEAASIPAGTLELLLQRFSRIVFATTVHGYEGTGRGFAVRFNKTLDTITPQWRAMALKTPVRWHDDDPLENFIFRALMLNASSAEDTQVSAASKEHVSCRQVGREELLQNDGLLSQIFGLLVSAHYRTRPFDLRCLLDCFDLDILVLEYQGLVIGTVLLTYEGALDKNTAEQILKGERWPQGHLLPEALTAHCGFTEATTLKCGRIMRIAIHPALQGKGLGSMLLDFALQHAASSGCDYMGSSFGIGNELMHFWYKNRYVTARLSFKTGRMHGEKSVMLLQATSDAGRLFVQSVHHRFSRNIIFELGSLYRTIEAGIADQLMQNICGQDVDVRFDAADQADVDTYMSGYRNFNSVRTALWRYMVSLYVDGNAVSRLDRFSRLLLVRLLLQGADLESVMYEFKFASIRDVEQRIKSVMAADTENGPG